MQATADRRDRYEALVRDVVEPLRRYALRRTDHASAEDAVAEALLVMWRRLEDVPAGGELPWCYAVARRCLANVDRSRRRQWGLASRIARLDPPTETAPEPATGDSALHEALRRLGPDDREILYLWAWEDLRPNEMAVVLDLTANAVSIRLHRAKKRLAAVLERDAASDGPSAARAATADVVDIGKVRRGAGQTRVEGTAVDEMGGSQ